MSEMICSNLCKTYGEKEVLRNLNLTLESGKIYGLVGRNGAGKTTLLSMMSNQIPWTGGTVTLDGESVWENRRALDRICFSRELNISAESGLANVKIRDYLKTASVYYPGWDKALAEELLREYDLNPKAKMGKLSKGMLSMVTILVALASKAEFTFLDEPVAGLDVIARENFYRRLLQEYEQTGRTFVISTHIIEEAADIMEQVLILSRGEIRIHEDTQHLLDRARFVTGAADQVAGATEGLRQFHQEDLGRSRSVTVLLEENQQLRPGFDVTVQPVSLQDLFAALCAQEG